MDRDEALTNLMVMAGSLRGLASFVVVVILAAEAQIDMAPWTAGRLRFAASVLLAVLTLVAVRLGCTSADSVYALVVMGTIVSLFARGANQSADAAQRWLWNGPLLVGTLVAWALLNRCV